MLWESVQKQGYTNKGVLLGDWIGREDKGGQGWLGYHLSANEWVEVSLRNQKAAKDFIPGGTTLNEINMKAVKRLGKAIEFHGSFTWQRWTAPSDRSGVQTVTSTSLRITWFPDRKISF